MPEFRPRRIHPKLRVGSRVEGMAEEQPDPGVGFRVYPPNAPRMGLL